MCSLVASVADGDGLDLQARAARQPCYTDQRARRARLREEGGEGVVDGGRVGGSTRYTVTVATARGDNPVERSWWPTASRARRACSAAEPPTTAPRSSTGSCAETKTRCPAETAAEYGPDGGGSCMDLKAWRDHDVSLPSQREKGASAKRRRAQPAGAQTSRIFAARMAALRAPLMATQATGTPGGICTMLSSESSPPRSLVLMGTPMTGTLV